MMRCVVAGMTAAALIVSPAQAVKRKAPATTAKKATAAKQPSPGEMLAYGLVANMRQSEENLATACKRVDPFALVAALKDAQVLFGQIKGEFETSADFEARRMRLATALDTKGQLIACQSLNSGAFSFTYDADKQAFSGALPDMIVVKVSTKVLPSIRTKTVSGIPFTVDRSVAVSWHLNFEYQLTEACAARGAWKSYSVPSPIGQAPALKANGQLVLLGDLRPPWFSENETRHDEATLSEPFVSLIATRMAYMRISRVVVIDGSGQVVWSCPGSALQ